MQFNQKILNAILEIAFVDTQRNKVTSDHKIPDPIDTSHCPSMEKLIPKTDSNVINRLAKVDQFYLSDQ